MSGKIGALWVRENDKGKYMSGVIELNGQRVNVIVFKNTLKDKEKQPDYNVLLARKQQAAPEPEKFEDDIPF